MELDPFFFLFFSPKWDVLDFRFRYACFFLGLLLFSAEAWFSSLIAVYSGLVSWTRRFGELCGFHRAVEVIVCSFYDDIVPMVWFY